ncbi:MAG: MBL fold metallo-hydrolase [Paucimonas sp.]|jgi:glyoxylase-like metal-dependent hydrolase (beta-lactamase superfamily II)|nr:MBL fold metallo-hydrolase [Paucimonas sp.]
MRSVIKAAALAVGMAMTVGAGAQEAGKREGSFVVHKLNDWLYAIGEPEYYQKNYSYLLLGSERALMFDAGANQKEDITRVAATLTDKPLSVLPSHLHFDHLGGLHNFSSVYLVDIPFTRKFKRDDGLYHVPEPVYLGNFDHMTVKPFKVDRLVKPGELIDLGGLQVRLLNTPGHTRDEVVLFDETHNVLLSGDHLYPSWLLAGNLKDYIASLDATLKLINPQTTIYGAHADEDANRVPAMTYAEVGKIREQMLAIQAGRAKGETFSDPELIKQARLFKVEKDISILTDIEFTDGRAYGYKP